LRAGCTEAEMRDAFSSLNLTGLGDGDKRPALRDIRNSILKN
jgi:hypothetical protein